MQYHATNRSWRNDLGLLISTSSIVLFGEMLLKVVILYL